MRSQASIRYFRDVSAWKSTASIVVFSNVDGVLFDVDTTLSRSAAKTFAELASGNVAVVLCSAKTRAEIEYIQQKLGISHPFICEHGSGVLIPDGYFETAIPQTRRCGGYAAVDFGGSYSAISKTLRRVADRSNVDIVSFSELSIDEVAGYCGLPLLVARLAKLRDYEEPFRILDDTPNARSRLLKGLHAAGLGVTCGRTFDYAGVPVNPRAPVRLLDGLYRRACGGILTAAVSRTPDHFAFTDFVDHCGSTSDDHTSGDGIDVLDWTNAIVNAVDELRRRAPAARG
jgi:hypothetical protein